MTQVHGSLGNGRNQLACCRLFLSQVDLEVAPTHPQKEKKTLQKKKDLVDKMKKKEEVNRQKRFLTLKFPLMMSLLTQEGSTDQKSQRGSTVPWLENSAARLLK